jgi:hypothetical protein
MGSSKQNGPFHENTSSSLSQILLIYGHVPEVKPCRWCPQANSNAWTRGPKRIISIC